MATGTHTLLERITVGAAGAASVTFSSIPQTGYTDLKIVFSARSARAANTDDMVIGFNGVNTNLTGRYLWGTGSAAASGTDTQVLIGEYPTANSTASTFSNCEVMIPNYTSANYKSFSADTVNENNATLAYATLAAGLWSSTAAITSITLKTGSGSNLTQYSTFSLYGIAASGTTPTKAPYASGGDTITTDGTYWYHTFINSGTFTPAKSLSADILTVGGGGGGGQNGGDSGGPGGGGGAVNTSTSSSLSTTAYTITVGAGGAQSVYGTSYGNGSNTTFGSVLTGNAGQGGYDNTTYGLFNGGSGGSPGGGLGGHGNGTGTRTGANGTASSYSGSSVTYGGGGGGAGNWSAGTGAAGGTGGGGAGGNAGANGVAGTANLGGGGGGGGGTPGGNGGAGGSGVVIVRYLA